MRKAAAALLLGAYVLIALTVAALFWRAGAGWGAGASALVATFGLALGLHLFVARALDLGRLQRQIDGLREANQILADHLEAAHAAIEQWAERPVTADAEGAARTEALTTEVRILEDLVARLAETVEARTADLSPAPAFEERARSPGLRRERQEAALLATVRDALAGNRVDLYLQPVVSLPQRKTSYYESYTRLRDDSGRVMMPAEYLAVAEPEGLVPAIDNLLLFRCVQIVRRLAGQDRKIGIFCNISLASLGDPIFFPQFLEFLDEHRDLAGALIFELGQAAFDDRGATEARNMAKLGELGFRFSLDKVCDLDLDFPDLARADVRFVKVTAERLLQTIAAAEDAPAIRALKDVAAEDFARLTRRYGLELIAEKVESERQVVDILELDVGLAQGNLFGEPRPIKDAVLAETAPPSGIVDLALKRPVRR